VRCLSFVKDTSIFPVALQSGWAIDKPLSWQTTTCRYPPGQSQRGQRQTACRGEHLRMSVPLLPWNWPSASLPVCTSKRRARSKPKKKTTYLRQHSLLLVPRMIRHPVFRQAAWSKFEGGWTHPLHNVMLRACCTKEALLHFTFTVPCLLKSLPLAQL